MYVLRKSAIYGHEIVGMASSWDIAVVLAEEAIRQENDDHHGIEVVFVPVNSLIGNNNAAKSYISSHTRWNEQVVAYLKRLDRRSGIYDDPPNTGPGIYWMVEVICDDGRTRLKVVDPREIRHQFIYPDPLITFVYDLLNQDPMAVDAVNDVLSGRK